METSGPQFAGYTNLWQEPATQVSHAALSKALCAGPERETVEPVNDDHGHATVKARFNGDHELMERSHERSSGIGNALGGI